MAKKDTTTYSRSVTMQCDNGVTVVHFPDLTDEEREKRRKELYDETVRFLKLVERINREKERKGKL